MKTILILMVGILYNTAAFSTDPPQNKIKKLSKKSQPFVEDMVVFQADQITVGRSIAGLIPTDRDTALLFNYTPFRKKHNAFAVSKYEVSNSDYRKFERYVRDSIVRSDLAKNNSKYYLANSTILDWSVPVEESLKDREAFNDRKHLFSYQHNGQKVVVNISPNQEVWTEDFTYSFNEPMTAMYYSHPAYSDYPVVGVSAKQAEAYCHWHTEQFKKSLSSEQREVFEKGSFRLPTALEWESAAQSRDDLTNNNVFAWQGNALSMQGNYGVVTDANNYHLKMLLTDGGFHTVKVDSYRPGMNGIHNMSGNVCEWTSTAVSDTIFFVYKGKEVFFLPGESESSIDQKIREMVAVENNIKGLYREDLIQGYVRSITHDCQIIKKVHEANYVKGGSWADPLIYAMIAQKEVRSVSYQSSRIGFRLVLDVNEDFLSLVE